MVPALVFIVTFVVLGLSIRFVGSRVGRSARDR
jgi:hypothetical protein